MRGFLFCILSVIAIVILDRFNMFSVASYMVGGLIMAVFILTDKGVKIL